MQQVVGIRRYLISVIVVLGVLACLAFPAEGAYSIGFKSDTLEITNPTASGLEFDRVVTVTGETSLDQVWFAVRGPGGEVASYPAEVQDGRFALDLWLRFGPGTYTVWAGDNPTHFDGTVRFEVVNVYTDDKRYLAPSGYVDSHKDEIVELAESLVNEEMTELEKLEAIYGWVTWNLSYDYEAYLAGENRIVSASQTLKSREGTCRDYAFVLAALGRAAGLETRVVYGTTVGHGDLGAHNHAWNEVRVDGRWVSVDATWDSGYIKEGRFVSAPSTKYFDPDTKTFAQTHQAETDAVH